MLLAVLGDVNGDVCSLDAALEAIEEAGIGTVLHTGNWVAGGPNPGECIARARERGIVSVQGGQDRLVVHATRKAASLDKRWGPKTAEAIRQAHARVSATALEWLRELPRRRVLTFEGKALLLCHGSVTSQASVLDPDWDETKLARQREEANTPVIIAGGHPEPWSLHVAGTLFAGPGTLRGATAVRYTIIDTDKRPAAARSVPLAR